MNARLFAEKLGDAVERMDAVDVVDEVTDENRIHDAWSFFVQFKDGTAFDVTVSPS